ncbi:hypothetical protein [Cupriavidus basilensis]
MQEQTIAPSIFSTANSKLLALTNNSTPKNSPAAENSNNDSTDFRRKSTKQNNKIKPTSITPFIIGFSESSSENGRTPPKTNKR